MSRCATSSCSVATIRFGARAGGQLHQNRRGDGIRQVGDEFPIAPVARFALEKFQRVGVEQFKFRSAGSASP